MHDQDDLRSSPLYSEDLAPVPQEKRTWNTWHLAALWVGMAVCIPTYLLASYMIREGLGWIESLVIIGVANLIITIPMVLNGQPGVKYGIPFPVVGRAAFGTKGIHIPSLLRGIVACGWYGVQTWVGGLAIHSIINAVLGWEANPGIDALKMISFFIFWCINMYFILKGTESIKWLEEYSAPVLIAMGLLLIGWGAYNAGGFGVVLEKSEALGKASVTLSESGGELFLDIHALKDKSGAMKAAEFQVNRDSAGKAVEGEWMTVSEHLHHSMNGMATADDVKSGKAGFEVRFRKAINGKTVVSSPVRPKFSTDKKTTGEWIWTYVLWLTIMVGFWATMSISISDITRFATSQKAQVAGQFIGLPGTMILYSFVGIFVTCAAVINFDDILISEDAPWDPVTLLSKFSSPGVVVVSQIFMLIATLSTNIAANVIAPANAFSNLFPKKISFRTGGLLTGIIGIVICPWWLMDSISGILIVISALLGPVLGILIADYYTVRKGQLDVKELFREKGMYAFGNGFNMAALIAMLVGIATALAGYFIPAVGFLYSLSWFTGFAVSYLLYVLLMKAGKPQQH